MHKIKRTSQNNASGQSHTVAQGSPASTTSDASFWQILIDASNGVHARGSAKAEVKRVNHAVKELVEACAKLPTTDLHRVIILLLRHALLVNGTAPCVEFPDWDLLQTACRWLLYMSSDRGDCWLNFILDS